GARRKVLLLLTDGEHNVKKTASGWSPLQAAQVAASLKVPIYAIDAGGDSVPEPGVAAADDSPAASRARAVETLRDMASITGGRDFSAPDPAPLPAGPRRRGGAGGGRPSSPAAIMRRTRGSAWRRWAAGPPPSAWSGRSGAASRNRAYRFARAPDAADGVRLSRPAVGAAGAAGPGA